MELSAIVQEIDRLVSQLVQARGLLTSISNLPGMALIKPRRGRPARVISSTKSKKPTNSRSPMSAEARAKIAAAQKARWKKSRAEAKVEQKPASPTAGSVSAKKTVARKRAPKES